MAYASVNYRFVKHFGKDMSSKEARGEEVKAIRSTYDLFCDEEYNGFHDDREPITQENGVIIDVCGKLTQNRISFKFPENREKYLITVDIEATGLIKRMTYSTKQFLESLGYNPAQNASLRKYLPEILKR